MTKPTLTENILRHRNKRTGILVPMIEDFMLNNYVNVETEEDVGFLSLLFVKMMLREESRKLDDKVFSPSSLSECVRKVFLLKNHRRVGVDPVRPKRIEPAYYFLNGNWLHVKWQFTLWKMMQAGVEGLEPWELDTAHPKWCEVPVMSKHGDHGGTLDIAVKLWGEPEFVDVKGVHVNSFRMAVGGNIPTAYAVQLSDYMVLHNSGFGLIEKVKRSRLLFENKGGPDKDHPAALFEKEILLEDFKPEVRRRLEVLRKHEAEEEIPPPECTSPHILQFQGCPFSKFCRKEVKEIYARRKAKGGDAERLEVARPGGNGDRRTRRNSRR